MMTMMRMMMTMMVFVDPGHTEMDRREESHCLQEYSKKQRNWALLLMKKKMTKKTKNLFETRTMTVRASTLLVLLLLMTKKMTKKRKTTVRASPLLLLLLVS